MHDPLALALGVERGEALDPNPARRAARDVRLGSGRVLVVRLPEMDDHLIAVQNGEAGVGMYEREAEPILIERDRGGHVAHRHGRDGGKESHRTSVAAINRFG